MAVPWPEMRISIVIPALNEEGQILETLVPLQPLRRQGHEIILSDGGSRDRTLAISRGLVDRVVESVPGRAVQMNAGARQATGDFLLFLHADTRLPQGFEKLLEKAWVKGRQWGRFDVRLSGGHFLFRVVETLMNLRSRCSGIATGDQAIFVRHQTFKRVGGFPEIPLMEDIALSRLLKRQSRPCCIRERLVTSSRRWEKRGIVPTILLMWWLRLQFFFGMSPDKLARQYR